VALDLPNQMQKINNQIINNNSMKQNIIIILGLVLFSSACVRNPEIELGIDNIATLSIDNQNGFDIQANSAQLYKISFKVNSKSNEIENKKTVKFSVTDGELISLSDLTVSRQTMETVIEDKIAQVFYRPSSFASNNIKLIAEVNPFSKVITMQSKALEPEFIQFEHPVYQSLNTLPIDLNLNLKSTLGKVSSGLEVNFDYRDLDTIPSYIAIFPKLSKTYQSTTEPFTKASIKVESLLHKNDSIMIYARYSTGFSDSAKVFFHE
jgi:hypothetical protein